MGTIALNSIELFGYHGVLPQERQRGNVFEVDVAVEYPFEETVRHDALETSLDYSQLFECVREVMQGPPRKLLETLILDIEERIRRQFPKVAGIRLAMRKLHPPVAGRVHSSEVRLSWPR